jgi:hypothetical protein
MTLEAKLDDINRFYRFKPREETYFTSNPSINIKIRISTKEEEREEGGDVEYDSINDLNQRKASYYHLWRLLSIVASKEDENRFLIERDLKTTIVNLFLSSRPLYSKIEENMSQIRNNEFSSLNDTIHAQFEGVESLRVDIMKRSKAFMTNGEYENPYVEDAHKYNDSIHTLLMELMPFLPTMMFIFFPLDYMPIFAFSLVFRSLLHSNYYTELAYRHYNEEGGDDDDMEYDLTNYVPYIAKEGRKHDIIDDHSPQIKLNISQFVVDTRKRRRSPSLQPSYFPFIINNVNTTFSSKKRTLESIDVHFQPNILYKCYQKLSKRAAYQSTPLNMYLVNAVNGERVSAKVPVKKQLQDEAYYEIYCDQNATNADHANRERIASSEVAEYMSMRENYKNPYNNDHWKDAWKIDNAQKSLSTEHKFVPLQSLTDNIKYHLRFKSEENNYYTSVALQKNQFSDKTLYIGIFHRPNKGSRDDMLTAHLIAFKGSGPKLRDEQIARKESVAHNNALMSAHFEEEIGIKQDLTIVDPITTVTYLAKFKLPLGYKRCSVRIHSPLLHYIRGEYARCIASVNKSIVHHNGEDYDPYDDNSLRILVKGKIGDGREAYLAIIPLIDFVSPTMTIHSHSVNRTKVEDAIVNVEKEPVEKSKQHELRYYNLIAPWFRKKEVGDEDYDVIMYNQTDSKTGRLMGVFHSTRLNTQGFYMNKPKDKDAGYTTGIFEELDTVTDLKLVVFGHMNVDTGEYGYSSTIKITPSRTMKVQFTRLSSQTVMLEKTIEAKKSIELEFVVTNKKDALYPQNGMVDKFSIPIKPLRGDVATIDFIYDSTRDDIEYGPQRSLTIKTTDKRLSKGMGIYKLHEVRIVEIT